MCVHAHHTHTCMYMHTHLLTPEREPTQTKVTTVLKSNLVNQLVFIGVTNRSIRVTYRRRDDSNVTVSQKSPTKHDIREAATLEFSGLQQLRNWDAQAS